jgi:hypothetical protein
MQLQLSLRHRRLPIPASVSKKLLCCCQKHLAASNLSPFFAFFLDKKDPAVISYYRIRCAPVASAPYR